MTFYYRDDFFDFVTLLLKIKPDSLEGQCHKIKDFFILYRMKLSQSRGVAKKIYKLGGFATLREI